MEVDLKTFKSLVNQHSQSIETIAVIGDMGELGENSNQFHQQRIEKINDANFHQVFIVGTCFSSFTHLFTNEPTIFCNNSDLIEALDQLIDSNTFIFLKGSNFNNLREISISLTKKISGYRSKSSN